MSYVLDLVNYTKWKYLVKIMVYFGPLHFSPQVRSTSNNSVLVFLIFIQNSENQAFTKDDVVCQSRVSSIKVVILHT